MGKSIALEVVRKLPKTDLHVHLDGSLRLATILDLAQKQRVVFDMMGSVYTTILDVRNGATCPSTEVPGACFAGFGAGKSFVDVTLDAGTYWVQVDGYGGDRGLWNLDMRVLPP